jgi:penicillin amidase
VRLPQLDARHRALLEAYAQGVNAGLDTLKARPFEYLVLRATPEPWRAEDTLLVNFAMYLDLNDENASRDATRAVLTEALPAPLEQFLLPEGTSWDAPLIGTAMAGPAIPGPAVCDLRHPATAQLGRERTERHRATVADVPMAGSNSWAIAASRSQTGRAIVANDMHLELTVPNIWYRMRWVVTPVDPSEQSLDITGVTLPGAPVVVAGSNGAIAWGFTNSYGDWSDLVVLEQDPADPARYRSPDGWQTIDSFPEVIEVRGQEAVTLEIQSTRWGPVIDTDRHGRTRVLHWLAHEPEATNMNLLNLETATTIDAAVRTAHTIGAPPQNIIMADRNGDIAWTIMGRIPQRAGYDPRLPASWAERGTGWLGWVPSDEYPLVINPESGYLWTANARTSDGIALEQIGRGGYDLGARAQQIRDRLAALDAAAIDDMLAIQLDDRALLEQRWSALLRDVLKRADAAAASPRSALREVLELWNGRADPATAGYRMAREFRRLTSDTLLAHIVFGCGDYDAPLDLRRRFQTEGAIWQLVTEQPVQLLPVSYSSWDEFLLAMADATAASCTHASLSECTWGEINRVEIRHPLARALEPLARWLTVHSGPLPGGQYTPRVQLARHGASERFAVSPGDEANGYFHMPGGQSGHPLSPFFRAGHDAWVRGERLAFLPGPAEHMLTLEPVAAQR